MKKLALLGLLFAGVGVLGLWWWGRTVVYPDGSFGGLYGGAGKGGV